VEGEEGGCCDFCEERGQHCGWDRVSE
jgi:hypothetical protein